MILIARDIGVNGMAKTKSRRQSQNSLLMRQIIQRLREYDLDEVEIVCKKYLKTKIRKR